MDAIMDTFKFADLSDSAKARALDWYREGVAQDWDGEFVIEDVVKCLGFLGYGVIQESRQRSNGAQYLHPAIYWQLAFSQGDGAVFEAMWCAKDMDLAGLLEHAPQDAELKRIGAQLMVQYMRHPAAMVKISTRPAGPGLDVMYAEFAETGREDTDGSAIYDETLERTVLSHATHDLCNWIYNLLREEYEYQTSDETCEEGIESGDYNFDEDGDVL